MKRTISLKLKVSTEQHLVLLELQKAFSHACQFAAEIAEQRNERNRIKLHHLCYYRIGEQFPDLGSQMSCNAIAKVANALKALKKKRSIQFKEDGSVRLSKWTDPSSLNWIDRE